MNKLFTEKELAEIKAAASMAVKKTVAAIVTVSKKTVKFLAEFWESVEHDSAVAEAYRAEVYAENLAKHYQVAYTPDYLRFGNCVYTALNAQQQKLGVKNFTSPSEVLLPEWEQRIEMRGTELVFIYEAAFGEPMFDAGKQKTISIENSKRILGRTLAKELEASSNYRFKCIDIYSDEHNCYKIEVIGIFELPIII